MIINCYSKKREFDIRYLQGYLHALAICCLDDNVCTYFEVYEIENTGDIEKSLFEERREDIKHNSKEYLGAYNVEELAACHQEVHEEIVNVSVNQITIDAFSENLEACFYFNGSNNGKHLVSEFIDCVKEFISFNTCYEVEFYDGNYAGARFLLSDGHRYLVISIKYND